MIFLVLECSGNADYLDMALLSNQFCNLCDLGVSEIRIKHTLSREIKELIWDLCARYDYYVSVLDDQFELEQCLIDCDRVILIDWINSTLMEIKEEEIKEYGIPVTKLIVSFVPKNQMLVTNYFNLV